jgi:Fe-S-cluster containining protein
MDEAVSPLDRILKHPSFEPFSGPKAYEILEKAKERLKNSNKQDILKAISSLGFITEEDYERIFKIQQENCERCGTCCTKMRPMNVTKSQLKVIAEKEGKSYKKIKKYSRARPNRDGTLNVSRNPCPFFEKGNCSVYDERPIVCRSYPASQLIEFLRDDGGYPNCPIADDLLIEIVSHRVSEEEKYRDDTKFTRSNLNQVQIMSNIPVWEKINYLKKISKEIP